MCPHLYVRFAKPTPEYDADNRRLLIELECETCAAKWALAFTPPEWRKENE
jgi:hypothetical protein